MGSAVAVNLKTGIVRDHPRLRASEQRKTLEAHGFSPIRELGRGLELEAVARALRPGDVVGFVRFWVLIDVKAVKRGKRKAAVLAAVEAFEKEGREAVMHEIASGRVSSDRKQRTAMIADALEDVTKRGQGRRSAENGTKSPGRPKTPFTEAQIEQARRVWDSRKFKTWDEAREKLPKGFTTDRAYRMFGKRNST